MGQNGESGPQTVKKLRADALNDLGKLIGDKLTRIRDRSKLNPKEVVNNPKTQKIIYQKLLKNPAFKAKIVQCRMLGLDEEGLGQVIIKEFFKWVHRQRKV